MTVTTKGITLEDFIDIMKQHDPEQEINDGSGMYSFAGLLRKQVRRVKPKRVLEWGPGISTIIIAVNAPKAEIISIESDLNWFRYWSGHFREFRNVKLYPLKLDGNYIEAPLALGKFDLIFVDGVDDTRARCLEVAAQVLNPDGVVLIHDSEREWYQPPIQKYFTVIDESERQWNSHTVALELKK